MLKAVCNAMARISPSAAAPTRPCGRYFVEKASAKPIAADDTTWRSVEPRKRTLPVNKPATKFPSEIGVIRKSIFSRSEEHTSELQSHVNLVCRLLLEK